MLIFCGLEKDLKMAIPTTHLLKTQACLMSVHKDQMG